MKPKYLWLIGAAAVIFGFGSCMNHKKEKVLTRTISFTKEGELNLLRPEVDTLIASLDIEIAESEYETQTGLMYRNSMEDHQAMLFIFEQEAPLSFYMKNTQFPLDIIYLDKGLNIVQIYNETKPFNARPLPSNRPAQYVLEVNAGLAKRWNLQSGDKAKFSRL